jgi:diaminopimelate epimerase
MPDRAALPLVKAHALGNDFLLAAAATMGLPTLDLADVARRACDRHRGIGADGLMLVADTALGAETRLFNADGGEAEVSGNGIRCAATWLAERRGLDPGATLTIGTAAGPKHLELLAVDGRRYTFRAEMGSPMGLRQVEIAVAGTTVAAVVMNVGNPQCVVLGPATADRLDRFGAVLARHPMFPAGTNVELASVEARDRLRILIWERGVGPTEASGTGACAAAVAAAFAGGAARAMDVIAPGGTQRVEWRDDGILLTGWAQLVAAIEWWGA